MHKCLLTATFLVICPLLVAQQTQPAPIIVRWKLDAIDSDLLVRNGLEIVMIGQDGLTVKVTLTVRDQRQVALVDVTNESGRRVEVIPSRMTLDLVEPEVKPFPYLDPDTLAESVRSTSGWAYVFDAMAIMGSGMATQKSYTRGSVGNTQVDITTTTHDQVPQDSVIENINRNSERKAGKASEIQYAALRENTVLPGEEVRGSVFFAPPKHYKIDYQNGKLETVLRVPVGDYVFEFPFWWEGTPQKAERMTEYDAAKYFYNFPILWKAKK